jgi:hypothetical protein
VEVADLNSRAPLLRIYSRESKGVGSGNYGLAARNPGDDWELFEYRFETSKQAEKHVQSLQLFFDEVAVVQYWPEETRVKLAREQDVDDENTGEI